MIYYVSILEEETSKAVGIEFPDLPVCFSGGGTLDEAMANAPEALALYADALAQDGRSMPPARTLTELKNDPDVAPDLRDHMVALIPFEPPRPAE